MITICDDLLLIYGVCKYTVHTKCELSSSMYLELVQLHLRSMGVPASGSDSCGVTRRSRTRSLVLSKTLCRAESI